MPDRAEGQIEIRRVRPTDQAALRELYADLSADSRHARFLGTCAGLTEAQSRAFATPDHQHAEGFIALDGDRLVGHLCLEPWTDERLELAVAVADSHQGRGIGRSLLAAAVAWARQHGCTALVATAYADNWRLLHLLEAAPSGSIIRRPEVGTVAVTVPLCESMPRPWRLVQAGPQQRRRPAERRGSWLRPPCRVVWRRKLPPVRDAAG
jgi:GNAT superfamily N-acetyltransferase